MEQGDWGQFEEEDAEYSGMDIDEKSSAPTPSAHQPGSSPSGNDVIARVIKVSLQEVRCEVIKVDGQALFVPCRGTIRYTDIMNLGIDKYDLLDCFRPGDIVRAKLVATGLSKTYLLTTTSRSCGVIKARSRCCKADMEPVASSLMRCGTCQKLEYRVVADVSCWDETAS